MTPLLERAIAKTLLLIHAEDHGPVGSDPKLLTTVTSETLQEQLAQSDTPVERYTIESILEQFHDRDYVLLGPKTGDGSPRQVNKVFPLRLKRQYNLWELFD